MEHDTSEAPGFTTDRSGREWRGQDRGGQDRGGLRKRELSAAAAAWCALAAAALAPAAAAAPARVRAPDAPAVKINEIVPDPEGADTLGREYLELVNTSGVAVDLAGWQIRDAAGETLHEFPPTVLPADTGDDSRHYLTVFFGPPAPTLLDDDFLDGDRSATAFSGAGNALGNAEDCIWLVDGAGTMVDAVLYGIDEPTGAGADAVRAAGHWIGPRVNTSFDEGGIPIADGGVLGRNLNSDDQDGAADWRVDGGANALGHTIGRRNNAAAFDSEGDLIWAAQSLVNNAVLLFGGYNDGYVEVVGAEHFGDAVYDPDLAGGYSVTSEHVFVLQDNELGRTEVLSGQLTASYERASGSAFHYDLHGTLEGVRHTLSLDVSQAHGGFGTLARSIDSTFSFTWRRDSEVYDYTNVLSHQTTWVAQDVRETLDFREWTDWSGIPKQLQQRITRTIQGDGLATLAGDTVRSFPFEAPAFGETQVLAPWTLLVRTECQQVTDGAGLLEQTMTRMDHSRIFGYDWATPFVYPASTLAISLQAGEAALLDVTHAGGDAIAGYGDYTSVATYPLQYHDAQGNETFQRHYTVSADMSFELTEKAGVSQEVGTLDITTSLDGVEVFHQSGVVDPSVPLAASEGDGGSKTEKDGSGEEMDEERENEEIGTFCPCGCGDYACSCGAAKGGLQKPPAVPRPSGKIPRRAVQLGTYGSCGLAVFGGPVAGLIGGAVSLTVDWFYDDVFE